MHKKGGPRKVIQQAEFPPLGGGPKKEESKQLYQFSNPELK